MSLEQREVRPFGSVEELNDLVHGLRLIVGDQIVEPDGGLVLEEEVYLRSGVHLRLAPDQSSLDAIIGSLAGSDGSNPLLALDLTIHDLEFVVIARSSFLRIVDIVDRRPLSDLDGSPIFVEVSGDPRRDSLRSPNSGCEITAMVCLEKTRDRMPLRPWRAGTWIAQTSFTLSTATSFEGFTPKAMDSDLKVELRLPPSTARFITMGSTSPLDEAATEASLEMWVDVDLLSAMSAMPRSRASRALQQQLFVDSISAVVRAARDNTSDDVPDLDTCTWSDIENTLMGRVITALAPRSKDASVQLRAYADLLDLLRDDPSRFMARAEALSGLLGSFDELLET